MKRTLSGSRAPKAVNAPNVPYYETKLLSSEIQAPQIPPGAREHIEYLSRFSPSQVCKWVEIWQRSKAQENGGTDPRNCCLRQKCSNLLGDESDTWALEILEEFPVKSEQLRSSSPIAPGGECARSQSEVAECPHLSPQGCMTSAPIVRDSLRKHTLEIYACSFCDKTLSRKGVWKRHEESLHEPQKQWCCLESGCNRKFTAGNKFRQHHKSDHGCENCKYEKDAAVMSTIQTTSAWGCGFCIALLTTWEERANHIGHHFDTGSKGSDWDFSKVVQGLLRQPKVFDTWQSLLRGIHGSSGNNWPRFEWPVESSGELLRSLQCANPEQSAIDIAQSAYSLPLHSQSGAESNKPTPYTGLCPFLAPATDQEFLVDPFEPGNSPPTLSNIFIEGNDAFRFDQPLGTLETGAADDVGPYDALLVDCHIVDEYFQNPKDYTTPCAETFEPTAWTLWPYSNNPMD